MINSRAKKTRDSSPPNAPITIQVLLRLRFENKDPYSNNQVAMHNNFLTLMLQRGILCPRLYQTAVSLNGSPTVKKGNEVQNFPYSL